nr:hypothetical protein [Nocardioides sp. B-3]
MSASDLRAHGAPEVAVAGRGERLDLQSAVPAGHHDRPDVAGLLVDREPQLAALAGGDQQGTEVDARDAVAGDL